MQFRTQVRHPVLIHSSTLLPLLWNRETRIKSRPSTIRHQRNSKERPVSQWMACSFWNIMWSHFEGYWRFCPSKCTGTYRSDATQNSSKRKVSLLLAHDHYQITHVMVLELALRYDVDGARFELPPYCRRKRNSMLEVDRPNPTNSHHNVLKDSDLDIQ